MPAPVGDIKRPYSRIQKGDFETYTYGHLKLKRISFNKICWGGRQKLVKNARNDYDSYFWQAIPYIFQVKANRLLKLHAYQPTKTFSIQISCLVKIPNFLFSYTCCKFSEHHFLHSSYLVLTQDSWIYTSHCSRWWNRWILLFQNISVRYIRQCTFFNVMFPTT